MFMCVFLLGTIPYLRGSGRPILGPEKSSRTQGNSRNRSRNCASKSVRAKMRLTKAWAVVKELKQELPSIGTYSK